MGVVERSRMEVFDPTANRKLPVTSLEVLAEYGGWRPVRSREKGAFGEWFALRLTVNESKLLGDVPEEARTQVEAAIERWTIKERLIDRCGEIEVEEVAEGGEDAVERVLQAADADMPGQAMDLRLAIFAARRGRFPDAVIARALETLDYVPSADEVLEGVEVIEVRREADGGD